MSLQLSLLRGIEQQINFLLDSQIPNKLDNRINLEETKEIQKKVKELLEKDLFKESLRPSVVSIILVSKKDDTWRMHINCRPILDELPSSSVFLKIDL